MKKLFLLSLLVLTAALSCAALAEAADTAPAPITGNIEEGSYEALIKENGYFADLVARQRLGAA